MLRAATPPRHLKREGLFVTADLDAVAAAMMRPSFELDANEAAAVLSVYDRARAAGHRFDLFTTALVSVLKRQIAETLDGFEDDTDSDEDDDSDRALGEWRGPTFDVDGQEVAA